MSLWRHQIETTGAIWMHPNANFYEPQRVPLCSHVPDGETHYSEFFSIKRHLKRRILEIKENQRLQKEREAAREARAQEYVVITPNPDRVPAYLKQEEEAAAAAAARTGAADAVGAAPDAPCRSD